MSPIDSSNTPTTASLSTGFVVFIHIDHLTSASASASASHQHPYSHSRSQPYWYPRSSRRFGTLDIYPGLPWQSSSVSSSSNHQAIPPYEHLTYTSSPSAITILQSVPRPAFAAEISRHHILYLHPTHHLPRLSYITISSFASQIPKYTSLRLATVCTSTSKFSLETPGVHRRSIQDIKSTKSSLIFPIPSPLDFINI